VNFTEPAFSIFFPVFLAVYFALRHSVKRQNFWIAAASFFFYGWFDWQFCLLLVVSTAADFYFGLAIDYARHKSRSKRIDIARLTLVASVIVNLMFLGFFKYFNFFVDSLARVTAAFGLEPILPILQVALPAGISFYTF